MQRTITAVKYEALQSMFIRMKLSLIHYTLSQENFLWKG